MHLPLLGSESHIISLLVIILNFSPSLSPSLSHTQTLRKQTKLTKSMSTLNHLFDLPEQICYVQCGFCTTILLVSVPCSSLSMVVTVRCGHCTSLLSVNMMKASFVPFQLLASLGQDDKTKGSICEEVGGHRKSSAVDRRSPSSSDNDEEYMVPANPVVNKPPEKRQRAPSAYNRFIKEEIRRLKAQNPNIPHKEAFSTAAKNWAHFPPLSMDNKRGGDTHGQDEQVDAAWYSDSTDQVHIQGNDFSERKAARNSIWTKTPFE